MSDHLRRAKVISIDAVAEIAQLSVLDESPTPERILSGRQELERVFRAIVALPGACRVVFVMRKFDGKSQKAIAAELQISENIVEKRMSRALRMILEQLQASAKEVANAPKFERVVKEHRDA